MGCQHPALHEMLASGDELRKADEAVIVLHEALAACQRTFDPVQDPGFETIGRILADTRPLADEATRRREKPWREALAHARLAHANVSGAARDACKQCQATDALLDNPPYRLPVKGKK